MEDTSIHLVLPSHRGEELAGLGHELSIVLAFIEEHLVFARADLS